MNQVWVYMVTVQYGNRKMNSSIFDFFGLNFELKFDNDLLQETATNQTIRTHFDSTCTRPYGPVVIEPRIFYCRRADKYL